MTKKKEEKLEKCQIETLDDSIVYAHVYNEKDTCIGCGKKYKNND